MVANVLVQGDFEVNLLVRYAAVAGGIFLVDELHGEDGGGLLDWDGLLDARCLLAVGCRSWTLDVGYTKHMRPAQLSWRQS